MLISEIVEQLLEWKERNTEPGFDGDIDVTVEDETGTYDSEILSLSTYEAGRPVFIVKSVTE